MVDDLINIIWVLMYGKNRVNNEINNINADKEEDVNIYESRNRNESRFNGVYQIK